MRAATSSALVTMKPSISSTLRSSAACSMAPAIIAISKPPKVASTASGSSTPAWRCDGRFDHALLAQHAVRRQARAGADAFRDRDAGQLVHQGGGGRRVPDAHLAEADHVARQVGGERARRVRARWRTAPRVIAGSMREVARAVGDLAVDQAGARRRNRG